MKTLEELAAEYAAAQSQRKSAEADLAVAARRMREARERLDAWADEEEASQSALLAAAARVEVTL